MLWYHTVRRADTLTTQQIEGPAAVDKEPSTLHSTLFTPHEPPPRSAFIPSFVAQLTQQSQESA